MSAPVLREISTLLQRCHSRTRLRDLAACFARVLLETSRPLNNEGAGNAGRPMRPIAAGAMVVVESTRVSQVTPESPGIPRAMVLTASFVLSPGTGPSCPCRLLTRIRKLDPSVGLSGPHVFSVRLSALRRKAHPRPPHPAP